MEESGWKNVHGDVFRPPRYPMVLSSLLGSGIQLFCMVLIVICEFSVPNPLQTANFKLLQTFGNKETKHCVQLSSCLSRSRRHVGDVVSVQQRSPDDHFLFPLHVHGVRDFL